MTDPAEPLREHLARALDWDEAHVGFTKATDGIPADQRGRRPPGFEHSAWDILEHMRLAQSDLIEFCVNPAYTHARAWPDDYWPRDPTPSETEWNGSLAGFAADRTKLQQLVRDGSVDLFALVPTGTGRQTYLRAILLVLDHNAYHLGQLLSVRRALGAWK